MAIAAARRAAVMSLRAASIASSLSPDTAKSSQTPLTKIERMSGRLAGRLELHGYQSICRFVFRGPKVPAGSVSLATTSWSCRLDRLRCRIGAGAADDPKGFTDEVGQHR